jgi:cytosine/adenosine deaminase-related metal-dependent hydrolase
MIIIASKLLTLQPGMEPISNGAVVLSHGIIQSMGPAREEMKKFPSHRVYSFKNSVLMPGLVNLHSHLELPLLLERVRAKTFPDWIINLIRVKKGLSYKDYQSATRSNVNTLIQTGATTVGEICTHGTSPVLLKQSGLRAVVFQEIISMDPDQKRLPLWPRTRPSLLMQTGISPHAPYTVSQALLRTLSGLSRKKKIRLAMHIAESKSETWLLQGKKSGLRELYRLAGWDIGWAPRGASSVNYLKSIGFLTPNLVAVHAVQITDEDILLIKKSKVSVAHCPRSNRETGVGKMPLKKLLDAGITVGLGTDSLASSPSLNMWDEMRYAHQIHRRSGISAEDILKLATINGAKAIGLDKEIGTLEPGKKADMIAVPIPRNNTGSIYSDLLRETKSCIMTMVNGKILYQVVSEEKQ